MPVYQRHHTATQDVLHTSQAVGARVLCFLTEVWWILCDHARRGFPKGAGGLGVKQGPTLLMRLRHNALQLFNALWLIVALGAALMGVRPVHQVIVGRQLCLHQILHMLYICEDSPIRECTVSSLVVSVF